MPTVDSSGLTIRTQAEILAEIEETQREEISQSLDLSTSSALGQLNRLMARSIRKIEEGLQALYGSLDPDTATGDGLRRLAALTGTYPEAPTKTRVSATCNLNSGTYAIGSLVVRPIGRPADLLRNVEQIVVAVTGNVSGILFDADVAGPLSVAVNTLEIASPLVGFNSVVSNLLGVPGKAAETDSELRLRRLQEVQAPGSSSVFGIAADISQNIPEVKLVYVIENATEVVVDTVPPHAIECVVWGPDSPTDADNDKVASQILHSKAAGIGTAGGISRTITGPEEIPYVVKFTRPTSVAITCAITLQAFFPTYPGDVELRTHIANRAAESFVPGLDASWSQVLAWAHEVPGVLRCTSIDLGLGAFVNRGITARQIASLPLGSVSVTTTFGNP